MQCCFFGLVFLHTEISLFFLCISFCSGHLQDSVIVCVCMGVCVQTSAAYLLGGCSNGGVLSIYIVRCYQQLTGVVQGVTHFLLYVSRDKLQQTCDSKLNMRLNGLIKLHFYVFDNCSFTSDTKSPQQTNFFGESIQTKSRPLINVPRIYSASTSFPKGVCFPNFLKINLETSWICQEFRLVF